LPAVAQKTLAREKRRASLELGVIDGPSDNKKAPHAGL
jgi:hypothetical protein